MNGIVRFSVLLALMTLALNVPCHACWWDDEDGFTVLEWWDKEEEDYTNSHFEFEINEPDEPNVSDNSNYYDFVDDYGSNEESDGYGGFDDYGSNEESDGYGGFDDYGSNEESDGYGGFDDYGSNEDEYGCGDFDDYDDNDFYDDCNDNYNDDNDTGSDTYDSFWDDFFFQDDDSWMDDGADPNDYNAPPSNDVEPIDPPGTNEGDGGGGNDGGNQVEESSTPTTNDTQSSIYHIPQANEKLFKDNLPAQTLKQECKMDCVPTVLATIISMSESDSGLSMYSDEGIRDQIEYMYLSTKDPDYSICTDGIIPEDYSSLMNYLFFYNTSIAELKSNIDNGDPCVAVIDNNSGKHMVAVVGYFENDKGVDSYQCINPQSGKYEIHTKDEFEKYPDYLYVRYRKD